MTKLVANYARLDARSFAGFAPGARAFGHVTAMGLRGALVPMMGRLGGSGAPSGGATDLSTATGDVIPQRTVIDTSPRLRRLCRPSIKTPPVQATNGGPFNRPSAALGLDLPAACFLRASFFIEVMELPGLDADRARLCRITVAATVIGDR